MLIAGIGGLLLIPLLLIITLAIPIAIGTFVYKDAVSRGIDSPFLWVIIAVFVPMFIGLIIYLVMRDKQNALSCTSCGKKLKQGFNICPFCGGKV